eukprot:CAMPEP_0119305274 /NCGR_PEP_ID=MMETSP1333-20130426/6313_1 /TAXON_ID=418940 /ORGANISM="Scyphosphaera apsteinii, Strain RCC1455" /LENGTH=214 /DNA_ID=CAMNT_0007308331 /DNA_START=146 /DNA_END=787 /DNA_ORIENTATION=-
MCSSNSDRDDCQPGRAKRQRSEEVNNENGNDEHRLKLEIRKLCISDIVEAVVLDLDDTLWRGNCEHFSGACVRTAATEIQHTMSRATLALYPEVPLVMNALSACGIPIAIASASPASETARHLLMQFGLAALVSHWEVHPGCKKEHLKAIGKGLGISALRNVLFFDDLQHNLRDVSSLGCTCYHVRKGLGTQELLSALRDHRSRSRAAASMRSW